EGAEPLPRARPAVADESGRSRRLEREPRDDRVARVARLARTDAGALRPDRDRARAAGRVGAGRGSRRAGPAGPAPLSGLAARVAARDGLRRRGLGTDGGRADRPAAPAAR